MVLAIAAFVGGVGTVDVAGGAHLAADHIGVGQIIHGLDGGILLHDDHLNAVGVAVGEVHHSLTLLGDGDTGHHHVALAGLSGLQGGVKVHIVHLELQAQLLGDGASHLYVDALEGAVVSHHLIGREGGVGGHGQLTGRHRGKIGPVGGRGGNRAAVGSGGAAGDRRLILLTAGRQGQHHGQSHGHSKNLFHLENSFSIRWICLLCKSISSACLEHGLVYSG